MNKHIRWGALAGYCVCSCVLMTGIRAFAQKTDIVEFGNGSRFVGEVKSLDRGKLYFKTDATDTITIDWADVTRVVTHAATSNRYAGRQTVFRRALGDGRKRQSCDHDGQ